MKSETVTKTKTAIPGVRREPCAAEPSCASGTRIVDRVISGAEDAVKDLPALCQRSVLQSKNYRKFLEKFEGVAPVSTPGAFAIAVAAARMAVERESPEDVLPPFKPADDPSGTGAIREMPGTSTEISNEPTLDGDRNNPKNLQWAYNNYDLLFTDTNPGLHGQFFFTGTGFRGIPSTRRSLMVTVNEPEKYSGPNGGQGDFILRVDPTNPSYSYLNFMAFRFDDMNLNSLQLQTFKDGGRTPLKTFTIVKHTDDEGLADFEDKNNMAVDPASGTVLVTNTRFFADGSGSEINGYFLKPKPDADGTFTGDFDFLNPKDQSGNPVPIKFNSSSNQVQWSQPGFLPGSKPIVAYRDFIDNNIYVSVAPGIAQEPQPAVRAANVENGVELYFADKFDQKLGTLFRALSAPQMAVNPADGASYIVYPDAKSGRSITYLVKSTDGGKTWTQPQPVAPNTRGPKNVTVDHWMSDVDVDPKSGAVAVGFLGIDDKGDYNAYVTTSLDGGQNWSLAEKVSQQTSNFMRDGFSGQFSGDYTKVLVRSTTANGKTSIFVDYAHPSAYLSDDPKVRVNRLEIDPQLTRAEMLALQKRAPAQT